MKPFAVEHMTCGAGTMNGDCYNSYNSALKAPQKAIMVDSEEMPNARVQMSDFSALTSEGSRDGRRVKGAKKSRLRGPTRHSPQLPRRTDGYWHVQSLNHSEPLEDTCFHHQQRTGLVKLRSGAPVERLSLGRMGTILSKYRSSWRYKRDIPAVTWRLRVGHVNATDREHPRSRGTGVRRRVRR